MLESGDIYKHMTFQNFDMRQIVGVEKLGQSIFKTTGPVECPQYAMLRTYQKWSKDGQ